jgi:hypothetical protein
MKMGTVEPIGGTDAVAFIRGAVEKYQGCGVDEELLAYIATQAHSQANNTGMDAIAEMDKAIRCLAIQVPESVYDDVKRLWDAFVVQQRHA